MDTLHALLMLLWGLGMPLLFYHRWWRLSRAYGAFSLAFLTLSLASHLLLGECFLTTLARELYGAADPSSATARISFVARSVEFVAGLRPSDRSAVLVWEAAIFIGSIGTLVHLRHVRTAVRGPHAEDDRQVPS